LDYLADIIPVALALLNERLSGFDSSQDSVPLEGEV
jgi:hypothetical protein